MITGLDHVVIVCPDLERAVEAYTCLFGYGPVGRAAEAGVLTAWFQIGTLGLELKAPGAGDATVAEKLRGLAGADGCLTSLAYGCSDIAATHRLFARRGLAPTEVKAGAFIEVSGETLRRFQVFRVPDENMAGIKTFVLELERKTEPVSLPADHISALDHVVIATPDPQRTLVTYGALLGLSLSLDRTFLDLGTRFLFFRLSNSVLEIVHALGDKSGEKSAERKDISAPDKFYGLTWEVQDLDVAHARMQGAGLDLSPMRTGRKPGSRVFTVREAALGTPTLCIAHQSA